MGIAGARKGAAKRFSKYRGGDKDKGAGKVGLQDGLEGGVAGVAVGKGGNSDFAHEGSNKGNEEEAKEAMVSETQSQLRTASERLMTFLTEGAFHAYRERERRREKRQKKTYTFDKRVRERERERTTERGRGREGDRDGAATLSNSLPSFLFLRCR
jgi:hypothetical protein